MLKKIRFIFLTISFVSLESCLIHRTLPHTQVIVHTTRKSTIIYGNDTLKTHWQKAIITVDRMKMPLTFTAVSDTVTKTISIQPIKQLLAPRRYAYPYIYPNDVYLNSTQPGNNYKLMGSEYEQNDVILRLSFPYINFFQLKPDNIGWKTVVGHSGIAAGIDYYYRNNQFVSLMVNAVAGYADAILIPWDNFSDQELLTSTYFSLTNNHILNRFTLGYGVSYSNNFWKLIPASQRNEDYLLKSNKALGLCLNGYYRIYKNLNIGIVYRPSFIRLGSLNTFQYEHLISIDFGWKFCIIKPSLP